MAKNWIEERRKSISWSCSCLCTGSSPGDNGGGGAEQPAMADGGQGSCEEVEKRWVSDACAQTGMPHAVKSRRRTTVDSGAGMIPQRKSRGTV